MSEVSIEDTIEYCITNFRNTIKTIEYYEKRGGGEGGE